MTDINNMINKTKSDMWMLTECLQQNKEEIDYHTLTELVSNMEAFIKLMKNEYGIEL